VSAVPHAVDRLEPHPCRCCGSPVLVVTDVDTDEQIVVDQAQVDGGHIVLWAIAGHAFARRYGQPARVQPAWEEHACEGCPPAPRRPAEDPYEDQPPAVQQHGGWRS
jgi:hypothetical protein